MSTGICRSSFLPAFVLAATSAGAADLLPPRTLDTPGLIATPPAGHNCAPVPSLGPRRPARLVIRDAVRPDVGPYSVQLPGYSTSLTPGVDDKYRPYLLTAMPGDTLRFDLVNQLPPAAAMADDVNLHTHGLIVQPRRCPPFGDSVYVENAPGSTARYAITIPATIPGDMFAGGGPNQPYPPGLAWFHAHVHGKARLDVMAGQAGILDVGDLRTALLAAPSLPAPTADMLHRTDVVYLGLRDIQLGVAAGKAPDQPSSAGQHADWLRGDDYDPGACPAQANPRQPTPPASFGGRGYCGHHGVTSNGKTDATRDTIWLFTVNGQYDPTIRQQAGRSQLWRIANLSANVSYLLELVNDNDPTGAPQDMDVVSLDGLVAGSTQSGGTDLRVGVHLKHLLLMPAGRAEVFVPAGTAANGGMTLRTAGITTGAQGDPWPRIDLAHIAGAPAPAASAPTALDLILPNAARKNLSSAALAPQSALAAETAPANCVTLPPGEVTRRRITFANNAKGDFVLGSDVVRPDGTLVDTAHSIPPAPFPHAAMMAPQSVRHVCPRFGEQEVWELVNTTGELHNFHIHQSKFRLATAADPGVPQGPLGIEDPTGIIARYVPEAEGATPDAQVDVWHDTLPVPPADATGKPGRVYVTIPFHAREQIGFFVFHCHILEHEDGGMMAVVQVFDPARPKLSLTAK